MRNYVEINGFRVWEHDYDDYKGKYQLSGLVAEGMCLRFARWLYENELSYDTAEVVYDNTSAIRDGNRLDIHDNYDLTEDGRYQIAYLWALENGIVYATVLDREEDKWVGEIEICC
jgi:hypothetical protein